MAVQARNCAARRPRRPLSTHASSRFIANGSSTGCTGVKLVIPESRPASAAGSDGSSSWTTTGVSNRRATSARWIDSALGERGRKIAQRTVIGDGPVSVGQFELSGQRDRTGRLHLDGAATAPQPGTLPGLFQRIDVLAEQALRPPQSSAATTGDAVAARHGVDADVDQQGPGPPDQVGADSPRRQFHEVRQVVQFTDDNFCGSAWLGAGPGTDTGGRWRRRSSVDAHARAMVALAMTSSPSASGRYSTMVWPGATPRSGARKETASRPSRSSATASVIPPCART